MRHARWAVGAIVAAVALALAVVSVAPVDAATTTVSFPLVGGSLTLTAPTSVTFASAPLAVGGTTEAGTLGTTTLSDTRGLLAHTDTVTMSTTNFTDAASDTINATNVTGFSGAVTVSGTAVGVPTLTGQPLAGAGSTILQLTGAIGSVSATYDPTVTITIPGSTIAGTYSATITQTAA